MLDSEISFENGKAVARKCVSGAEPFVPGHYPGYPLFPGVLSLSLLTTVCEALLAHTFDNAAFRIAAVEKIRYSTPLLPGDVVDVVAEIQESGPEAVRVAGTIRGDGKRKIWCVFQATRNGQNRTQVVA